jgi:hypothetical protein
MDVYVDVDVDEDVDVDVDVDVHVAGNKPAKCLRKKLFRIDQGNNIEFN